MNLGNTISTHDSSPTPSTVAAASLTMSDNIGAFAYDMAFILGFFVLVTLVILASYTCICASRHPPLPSRLPHRPPAPRLAPRINEAALLSYPKILYSSAKGEQGAGTCPICLGDYRDSDLLRLLPDCGHFFHVKCIDPWLRSSPTCPVCRKCQCVERVHDSVILGN
ncbi:hypothetical protein MLD38_002508 [Melastoma candidum]|uniref:Uncharacterized protein n=1 Tax=Melastoma candidum TaxID=119954 RepID=A0ACB9S838_9MYRT|nr:hypothetical protein MLD38_002508 [Melastoma candidum]